ncbi:MAG TPA: heme-binding protein [Beijerinckiaceae bacterium]|jgi:uncharacterized protein GlcG (DUF336 family)|nr:heme-binding protein [Beijerinckiaceae bacterium]
MPTKYVLLFAAALAVFASSSARSQVITHRDVGSHMAMKIIAAAVAKCEQNGDGLTVAVVDREGVLRGFLMADRAAPHYSELAQRKAYTALTSRKSSEDWAKATEPGSQIAGQRNMARVIPLAGGFPIKVGDETIGAVGVSGSQTSPDPVCAQAGLDAIADELK